MSSQNAVIVDGPGVKCPECGEEIPTSIDCRIQDTPDGPTMFEMTTEPDLSDFWAHYWGEHA